MLTCVLNGQRINCYDESYSKEQLKKWASKKILICPACGKPYEYCHGRIKSPYFRHMDKEQCEDKYSEPETEEHLKGKIDLYEWIKNQQGITDAVLEGWIPETKQKPDIMFKYRGKQYVLEYQCTPISSEYYERHELYEAAGIKDIWILGTEKYFTTTARKKCIQDYAIGHYSTADKNLILYSYTYFYYGLTKNNLNYKIYHLNYNHYSPFYCGRHLDNYIFTDGEFVDFSCGKLKDIKTKREFRKQLRVENFESRKPGKYLHMQQEINFKKEEDIENKVKCQLNKLSNENWSFYLYYTHSKYKHFCYICAIPEIKTDDFRVIKARKDFEIFSEKIKFWKLNQEEKLACCNDIEYLKKLLTPIMRANMEKIKEFKFDGVLIL